MIDIPTIPKWAINLAYRVMQLLASNGAVTITLMVMDGKRVARFDNGPPEKLG